MTVYELIKELVRFNPDLEVLIQDDNGVDASVASISESFTNKYVLIGIDREFTE